MSHCPECARLESELAQCRIELRNTEESVDDLADRVGPAEARVRALESELREERESHASEEATFATELADALRMLREEREQSDALRSTLNEERDARLKFGADVDDLRLLVSDIEEQLHAANESHAVVLGKLAASEAALAATTAELAKAHQVLHDASSTVFMTCVSKNLADAQGLCGDALEIMRQVPLRGELLAPVVCAPPDAIGPATGAKP